MLGRNLESLLKPFGAGIGAAAGLGFVNRAAHVSEWGQGILCATAGLLAAWTALRLVSKACDAPGAAWGALGTSFLMGALLLSATYLEGRTLWAGGAWLAAAGSGTALALEAAALRWGKSVRGLQVLALVALCGGVALARYSLWNAVIAGVAALLPPAALLLEKRVAALNGAGRDASGGVRWRLFSAFLWGSL